MAVHFASVVTRRRFVPVGKVLVVTSGPIVLLLAIQVTASEAFVTIHQVAVAEGSSLVTIGEPSMAAVTLSVTPHCVVMVSRKLVVTTSGSPVSTML